MMKRLTIAAAAVAILTVGAFSAHAQDASIRVAVFTADPFRGYCEELMPILAERAGLQISEFQETVVADMMPAVADGTVDVLCSGLPPTTQAREAGLAFTSAILTSQETVAVLSDNNNVYRTFGDFAAAGAIIGAERGTSFNQILADAGVTVREYATTDEIYAAVRAGEITGWIRSAASFFYNQAALGNYTDLKQAEGYIPTLLSYAALAVHQDNTALLGQIQAALESVKADGTLAEIAARWGMPLPPF